MKVLDYSTIAKDDHIGLYRLRYINRAGKTDAWTVASREANGPKCCTGRLRSADAVVVVPYHRERKQLAIIREFRVALGGYQYGFPAGLVDPDETIQEAASRELAEETGLRVVGFLASSPVLFTSSGITDESVVMVYLDCTGTPSDAGNSPSEQIETHFVSPTEAKGLCQEESALMDVKTWLVLASFSLTGALLIEKWGGTAD